MLYPIELDKQRNFKYGMRAIDLAEKKFKKPLAKIDMEDLTIYEMATIIWAGLYLEDKSLTIEKVMDIIDDYSNVTDVFKTAMIALTTAFTGKEPEQSEIEENVKNALSAAVK